MNDDLAKLYAFIEKWRDVPFAYGTADCCMFVADWAHEVTGTDPAAKYRDEYDDEAGAAMILASAGGMAALLSSAFGEPLPAKLARRGDIVAGEFPTGEACGIVVGLDAAFMGTNGVTLVPLRAASHCWRMEARDG